MRTRSFTNIVVLLCALLGGADALFLTIEHYRTDLTTLCGANGGCTGALQSAYGQVGPIPTALFGFGMYLVLFVLALRRQSALRVLSQANAAEAAAYATAGAEEVSAEDPPLETRRQEALRLRAGVKRLDLAVWLLALAGVGISWWLQYIALYKVLAFCPFCFFSACLITVICIFATWDFLADRALNGESKLLLGVCSFIALMLGLAISPGVVLQYKFVIGRPSAIADVDKRLRSALIIPGMYEKGDLNAPGTIVEFADYECPACRRAWQGMDALLAREKGKYKLAFRNLPLPIHSWSHAEAEAAMAAGAQGKFWQMHDKLYQNQAEVEKPTFNMEQLYQYAQEVGLNMEQFRNAMQKHTYNAQVDADAQTALNLLRAQQTPTFVVFTDKTIKRVSGFPALQSLLGVPPSQ